MLLNNESSGSKHLCYYPQYELGVLSASAILCLYLQFTFQNTFVLESPPLQVEVEKPVHCKVCHF